jgi:hypothetical protein
MPELGENRYDVTCMHVDDVRIKISHDFAATGPPDQGFCPFMTLPSMSRVFCQFCTFT